MNFFETLFSILILLALGIPGFVLKKLKLLNDHAAKNIANLTLFIGQPAIVIVSFQKESYSSSILNNMLIAFALSFTLLLLIATITFFAFKPFIKDSTKLKIITLSSTFGNSIFMGFPIINMLIDDKTGVLVYLSIFAMAFNILTWTFGAFVLSGDKKYISLKNIFLNPPTITALVMLPLFFLNVHFPEKIIEGFGYLANMAVPLSMTVFGIKLTQIKIKDLFNDKGAYITSFIKLIASPLLVFLILWLIPIKDGQNLKLVLYILFMMPTANTIVLFTEKFGADSLTASKTVLLSTLISCITIPLLLMLSF